MSLPAKWKDLLLLWYISLNEEGFVWDGPQELEEIPSFGALGNSQKQKMHLS